MGEGEEGTLASFGVTGGGREGVVRGRAAVQLVVMAVLTLKQMWVGDDGVVGLLGWLGHERTDQAAGLLGQLGLQQANQGKRFGPNWMIQ
jgi:hypothetical protein